MAKRFTDTDKFIDPWYRRLSTQNKLLWDWITCSCDYAGFISIDLEFVEMILGEKYEDDVIEKHFSDRVLKIGDFKFFIPKFIKFQYGKLNPESKVHKSVIRKLSEHGIDYSNFDASVLGYTYSIHTTKDKDKDKDKDKNKIKEINNTELVNTNPSKKILSRVETQGYPKTAQEKTASEIVSGIKGNATVDMVIELYNQELAGVGKLRKCPGLGAKSIKELLNTFSRIPTMDQWLALFTLVKANTALTGASKTVFLATLDWLVKEDNALNVLAGKYEIPSETEFKEMSVDNFIKNIKLEA